MNRSSSLRVVDSGRQTSYDSNWTDLGETVALSHSRSKSDYKTFQKMTSKVQNGQWPVPPRTIWNPVSKAKVASENIEKRCKKFMEQEIAPCKVDRPPCPKTIVGELTTGDDALVGIMGSGVGTSKDRIQQAPEEKEKLHPRLQETTDHGPAVVKCHHCGDPVYHTELLELPQRGATFHERCFRCFQCGLKLTFKTFVVNQKEPNDREVYCQVHAPRLDAAKMDTTAKLIYEYQRVPKVTIYNGQIRGPDAGKAIKYDTSALLIQSALKAPRPTDIRKAEVRAPSSDIVKSDIIGLRYF